MTAARGLSDPGVAKTLAMWPEKDLGPSGGSLPLRLMGALHAIVLEDRDKTLKAAYPPNHASQDDEALWNAVDAAVGANSDFVRSRLEVPPQTNEMRRSAALLPGFFLLARRFHMPLVLSEIGASVGLNLLWDCYFYHLGGLRWGDPDSPVHMKVDWPGASLVPTSVMVTERCGCDLWPVGPDKAEGS